MKFSKTYTLSKWTEWHKQINESISEFYGLFSFYPNILEANRHTHSQIDFVTNINPEERKKLLQKNSMTGEILKPKEGEEVGISAFIVVNCELDFAVDEKLEDREIRLVYDSDPDWEDENNPGSPVETDELSFTFKNKLKTF